jgi:hypothetical protein
MESCTYYTVLDRAAALAGFTATSLTATPRAQFNTKITARLKTYWERAWWPELMRSELRYYRDTWTPQTYTAPSQVYDAATNKYWENLTLNAANIDVPGVSPKWTVVAKLDPYIAYKQAGLTALGKVRWVTMEDPMELEDRELTKLPFLLGVNGVQVQGETVPNAVFLYYRLRVPPFYGPDYLATAAYPINQMVYYVSATAAPGFEGDYWTAVSATVAGENPETTPAKWRVQEFPAWLRECVARGAYSDWLRLDGAGEAAMAEEGMADAALADEVIKLAGQRQTLFSRSS